MLQLPTTHSHVPRTSIGKRFTALADGCVIPLEVATVNFLFTLGTLVVSYRMQVKLITLCLRLRDPLFQHGHPVLLSEPERLSHRRTR